MYDNLNHAFMKAFLEKERYPGDKSDKEKQRKTNIHRPGVSKETFCKAIRMILKQEAIDEEFGHALQKVGNGFFVFGTENKYLEALMMVLKETVNDQYGYIDWWLYEGAPNYEAWCEEESKKWVLKEPEDLYVFIITECQ